MNKLDRLKRILAELKTAVLAYSGGVDSVFLAAVAGEVLKDDLLAVTADSPTYPPEELRFARKAAAHLGLRHLVIKTAELKDKRFSSNSSERCYYCKRRLFAELRRLADARGIKYVIDAANISDNADYRPGNRAKKEFFVRSPLQEAGFNKEDIRRASKKMGLSSWNKPAMACLASRIAYGTPLRAELLARINKTEQFLGRSGLPGARVRHYGNLCRIETDVKYFPLLLRKRREIVSVLKRAGYSHITLDLQGYRQGSLNLDLPSARRPKRPCGR